MFFIYSLYELEFLIIGQTIIMVATKEKSLCVHTCTYIGVQLNYHLNAWSILEQPYTQLVGMVLLPPTTTGSVPSSPNTTIQIVPGDNQTLRTRRILARALRNERVHCTFPPYARTQFRWRSSSSSGVTFMAVQCNGRRYGRGNS